MTEAIRNAIELKQWFFEIRNDKKAMEKGIMVVSRVRKELLTSTDQGKTIVEGKVEIIKFENLTGGVYRAYI